MFAIKSILSLLSGFSLACAVLCAIACGCFLLASLSEEGEQEHRDAVGQSALLCSLFSAFALITF